MYTRLCNHTGTQWWGILCFLVWFTCSMEPLAEAILGHVINSWSRVYCDDINCVQNPLSLTLTGRTLWEHHTTDSHLLWQSRSNSNWIKWLIPCTNKACQLALPLHLWSYLKQHVGMSVHTNSEEYCQQLYESATTTTFGKAMGEYVFRLHSRGSVEGRWQRSNEHSHSRQLTHITGYVSCFVRQGTSNLS